MSCEVLRQRSLIILNNNRHYRMNSLQWSLSRFGTRPVTEFLGIAPKLYSTSTSTEPINTAFLKIPAPEGAQAKSAPIVVLHGFLGSKMNNRSVCKRFAKELGTTVYALDLRNHGDSPHTKVHDYPHLALDVENFIDTHVKEPCVILGHSMGAKTAMAVALRRPDITDTMIAVDNAPIDKAVSSEIPRYVQGLLLIEKLKLKSTKAAFEFLEKYEKSAEIRQFLLTNTKIMRDGTVGFRVPLKTLARSLDHIAEFPFNAAKDRYEGPSLFVRGTKSAYVPDEAIPTIGLFFPKFVLKDVDSGHWVISEKPAEFVEIVEEFLTGSLEE
ncbi:Alpha/Beta hydrolase protein [Dipodascopsis uninucleata]